ncbi:MAG: hypothetical protein HYR56_30265 [Acidobacteria bacterium]|nr:hypothetical protein [Acidobacteriota bacterium]MBI3424511.1 hypothetical protein [Acidobacteriota bacterium]
MAESSKNLLLKWLFTLVAIPLFWLLLFTSFRESAMAIWLIGMAFYIPLALYVGGKITLQHGPLSAQADRLRYWVVILGKIEWGLFTLLAYFLFYLLLFNREAFWAD